MPDLHPIEREAQLEGPAAAAIIALEALLFGIRLKTMGLV